MIHGFPITPAHTAPAGHDITPSHKIIKGQNSSPSHGSNKKTDSARGFGSPNTLPRKSTKRNLLKRIIIQANIETTLLIQPPPHNIIVRIRGNIGIKLVEEGSYHIHFPVIEVPNKANIPIHPPILMNEHRVNSCLPVRGAYEQCRKQLFQRSVTTPSIRP